MSLELVPLCHLDIQLRDPIYVGDGPAGTRIIFEVESGKVSGERVNGTLRGASSGDWFTIANGVGTLDVRATIETDDGASILAHYVGRTEIGGVPGTSPVYCAPTFETGDDRYKWLNAVQAVGHGTLDGSHLEYDWFEVRVGAG